MILQAVVHQVATLNTPRRPRNASHLCLYVFSWTRPLRSQSMSPLDSSDGTPPQPQAVPRTPWLDVLSGAKMISRRPRCFQREHCLNFRQKLSVLSKAWLGSPSLLLVCIAGGIRDAGGYVFGYYLPTYFSPLMASNPSLTANDNACSFSYSDAFDEEQVRPLQRAGNGIVPGA